MTDLIPFEKILKEALKNGGEFADIFFEQTYSVAIVCEEDRIEKMISGRDIGLGLRVLFDGRTFYSFTNRLGEEDLLQLASVVSRAVKEDCGGRIFNFLDRGRISPSAPSIFPPRAHIEKHPQGIPIREKVSMVNRANEVARKLDSRVRQVKVLYRDASQFVSIANSEGLWVEG